MKAILLTLLLAQQTTCSTTPTPIPAPIPVPEDLTLYTIPELETYQFKCEAEVKNAILTGDTNKAQAWGKIEESVNKQLKLDLEQPQPQPQPHYHYHRPKPTPDERRDYIPNI